VVSFLNSSQGVTNLDCYGKDAKRHKFILVNHNASQFWQQQNIHDLNPTNIMIFAKEIVLQGKTMSNP